MSQSVVPEHVLLGLESVSSVMDRLTHRAKHTENLDVDRVFDLGLRYEDQSPSRSRSGYYARIAGRDMRLTDGAIKTACRQIKVRDSRFYSQFADKNKFVRDLHEGIDLGTRKEKGVLVRHNGLEVTAILPRDYVIKDSVELLGDFLTPLEQNLGKPLGIYSIEQGNGDKCSYRVVMGNNIMKDVDTRFGQFMMFILTTSDHGLQDTETALGLYRSVCTNSALREEDVSSWNHKTSAGAFYDKAARLIESTGVFADQYGQIFGELLNTRLDVHAQDLLSEFQRAELISRAHYDIAKLRASEPTEDGREVETQYDLFNALTRAARDLPTIEQRERAEQSALQIFTYPGGIREVLRLNEHREKVSLLAN